MRFKVVSRDRPCQVDSEAQARADLGGLAAGVVCGIRDMKREIPHIQLKTHTMPTLTTLSQDSVMGDNLKDIRRGL
jgi:hypothetical protein